MKTLLRPKETTVILIGRCNNTQPMSKSKRFSNKIKDNKKEAILGC
jgi:hypothetical protein